MAITLIGDLFRFSLLVITSLVLILFLSCSGCYLASMHLVSSSPSNSFFSVGSVYPLLVIDNSVKRSTLGRSALVGGVDARPTVVKEKDLAELVRSHPKISILVVEGQNLPRNVFREIANFQDLRELSIREKGTLVFDNLAELGHLKHLVSMEIEATSISAAGFRGLVSLPQLEGLYVYPHMAHEFVQSPLRFPLGASKLTCLKLVGCRSSAEDFRTVENLHNLRGLFLENCHASTAGFRIPGNLNNLGALSLEKSNITDEALADVQGLKNLRNLNLNSTSITSHCLNKISCIGTLETLGLANTRVDDSAFQSFHISNLSWLNLNNTHVGDRSILQVASMVRNQDNRLSLSLDDTLVTPFVFYCLRKLRHWDIVELPSWTTPFVVLINNIPTLARTLPMIRTPLLEHIEEKIY